MHINENFTSPKFTISSLIIRLEYFNHQFFSKNAMYAHINAIAFLLE